MTDPTTLKILPKAMVPTGTITGWKKRIKPCLQVDKPSVVWNAMALKIWMRRVGSHLFVLLLIMKLNDIQLEQGVYIQRGSCHEKLNGEYTLIKKALF